jgi:hypothetical protein
MVFGINILDTMYATAHPLITGNIAAGRSVVSIAKTIEVSTARDAPVNIAVMPTNPATRGSIFIHGARTRPALPIIAPSAPPIVNNGARVPPDVPLPNEIAQERNLNTHSITSARCVSEPLRRLVILS